MQGISCGALPTDHTFLSNTTGPLTPGNVAEVTCLRKMKFEDGYSNKTIVCTEDGSWSQKTLSCQGTCTRSNTVTVETLEFDDTRR